MRPMRTYPNERQLIELSYSVLFPVRRDEMIAAAREFGCAPAVMRLLRRFNPDDVFENGVDFINRCEDVELFAREEHAMPKELLRNPQC